MISLGFFFWNTFLFLLYLYLEVCISLVYYNFLKSLKFYKIIYTKKTNNFIYKYSFYLTLNNILIFFFLTLKFGELLNSLLSYVWVYLVFNVYSNHNGLSSTPFINFNILFFLSFFFFLGNLFSFFLFIEVYSIFFFFFFWGLIVHIPLG